MNAVKEKSATFCYHCGERCDESIILSKEKTFCCEGCKAVFEIISGHNLCEFYNIDGEAGFKINEIPHAKRFDYLDDKDVEAKIIEFKDKSISSVSFSVPDIHCSSCVWLLERLNKVDPGVASSRVDFLQKRVSIIFYNEKTSLKNVVKAMASVGYEPNINLESETGDISSKKSYKDLYARIGVAGFCLGNIMLLSFPEYLNIGDSLDGKLQQVFNFLNILLGIPVIAYCSSVYFASAWKAIRKRFINIDFPISLGLLALFTRSVYEIAVNGNAGFMDSLAGLVFFLLIGKLFQSKTYDSISFERDFRAYFPISVTLLRNKTESCIPVSKLSVGDRIIIRNNEIVPVDAILFKGEGFIDYSFVTGESVPEQKVLGEIIYAGGKHLGSAIELEVIRTVSQSYLTQLWNDKAFDKQKGVNFKNISDITGKYFTFAILFIAFVSAAFWLPEDPDKALSVFTTVLIIACPCALALTTPFALGNSMRILGRNKLYLRNAEVIEAMAKTDTVIFDKTGTITNPKHSDVEFTGSELSDREAALVRSVVRNSTHPLSRKIYDHLNEGIDLKAGTFSEDPGEGIFAEVDGSLVKIGSIRYILGDSESALRRFGADLRMNGISTNVFLSIDGEVRGFFSFRNKYRAGLEKVVQETGKDNELFLISGDNSNDKRSLSRYFAEEKMLFGQLPSDKLLYVKSRQSMGKRVMMIGDGLNDAGALKQSDVGIAVTDDVMSFSPACDAVMDAGEFSKLASFIDFSRSTLRIIKVSFVISFIYNVIGLYLAAQGFFSPMIAAILMPFNSVSIVLFVVGMTNLSARRKGLI